MIVDDALQRIDSVLQMAAPAGACAARLAQRTVPWSWSTSRFSYDGVNDALKNVSLSIPAGATVAFVGPSGGGKTTLANVISRFFDPQSGAVYDRRRRRTGTLPKRK